MGMKRMVQVGMEGTAMFFAVFLLAVSLGGAGTAELTAALLAGLVYTTWRWKTLR